MTSKQLRPRLMEVVAIYGATPLRRLPQYSLWLEAKIGYCKGSPPSTPHCFKLFVSPILLDADGRHVLFGGEQTPVWSVAMATIEQSNGPAYNRHRHQKIIDDHRHDPSAAEALMRKWCEYEGVTLLGRELQSWDEGFIRDDDAADGKGGAA